jgi:hypothetical protein
MRSSTAFLTVAALSTLLFLSPTLAQKQLAQSSQILASKTVYFENKTGSDVVGKKAIAQLKKWGKFQIVTDRKQADLVLLLSADPYKGGNLVMSGGQTGKIDDSGRITEDPVPNYNKQSPTRYAYLTVIDPNTGANLWSEEHLWGGILTGVNSVGARLVRELERQAKN